MLALKFYKN